MANEANPGPESDATVDGKTAPKKAAIAAFALERTGLVVATLGFALLVVKVSRVSHLNARTSLGLLETAGPVEVVLGSLLAELPFILLTASALVLWWAVGTFASTRTFGQGHLAAAGLLLLDFLVLPWPFLLTLAVITAIRAAISFGRRSVGEVQSVATRRRLRGYYIFVGFIALLLLADADMWVPSEAIELRDGTEVVGYVLEEPSNAAGWIEVLTEEERGVVHLRLADVSERHACRIDTGEFQPENYGSVLQLAIREDFHLPEPFCPEGIYPEGHSE